MKKFAIIVYSLIIAAGTCNAQSLIPWALFPGSGRTTETTTDTLDTLNTDAPADTTAEFILDIPSKIELALLLPLKATRTPDKNAFDFYSGALLAARDFGRKGISVGVSTYDTSDSAFPVTAESFKNSDIVIGPFKARDVNALLPLCREGMALVSPLDPQAAALAESSLLVQVPSSVETQVRDIVAWLAEELVPGDNVVVVSEADVPLSDNSKTMLSCLAAAGIPYEHISYDVLKGLQMADRFAATASAAGTTRFLVASENEAFIGDAIRNMNLMAFKKMNVTVYSTAKVKSCSMIDVDTFHTVQMRMSASYFTDYNSPDVQAFILAYRAIFHNEPDSFAFHGYDTAHFLLSMCSQYGRQWHKKLPEYSERGLQANFNFKDSTGKGLVNNAVRRIIYNPDYSITVL